MSAWTMSEAVIKVKDRELAEVVRRVAERMGLTPEDVVALAVRTFIAEAEAEALERRYYELLERVERMSMSPTSYSSIAVQECLRRLSELKRVLEERRRVLRGATVIERLGEVTLSARELERMGKVVIRGCGVVTFEDDVTPELIEERVAAVVGVGVVRAPRRAYHALLPKCRLCGRVEVRE
ncbi:MAG: hypothetical protein DRJ56_07050 [Thermoprotei archaeon]|nr:MAG: hypothetical protein DRJ56_07050 [Thermoprotei archaeon]